MLSCLARISPCLLLAVASTPALSCSCVQSSLSQRVSEAEQIFIGRVTAIREAKSRPTYPSWGGVQIEVAVSQGIKGTNKKSATVISGFGGGDCGVPVAVGRNYIFFANGLREVDICSGTRSFNSEQPADNQYLNQVKSHAHPAP